MSWSEYTLEERRFIEDQTFLNTVHMHSDGLRLVAEGKRPREVFPEGVSNMLIRQGVVIKIHFLKYRLCDRAAEMLGVASPD